MCEAASDSPTAPICEAQLSFAGVLPKLVPTAPVVLSGNLDVDVEARTSQSFALSEEELIELTKQFLNVQFDFAGASNPNNLTLSDLLADNFEFWGPVVGPLGKDTFAEAFGSFKVADAFPDGKNDYYQFHRDPYDPARIWFITRFEGKNTGTLAGFLPATNKKVETPPQAQSCTFNAQGQITKFTIGYVLDRNLGNTGGLGGVYGLFYAIGYGLPFPEGQPWQPSPPYFLLTRGGRFVQDLLKPLQSVLPLSK